MENPDIILEIYCSFSNIDFFYLLLIRNIDFDIKKSQ